MKLFQFDNLWFDFQVKTTKELLEQIQSRGSKPASRPASPASPASPDVMLIEPDCECPTILTLDILRAQFY